MSYADFITASEDVDGVRFSWNVIPTNRIEATRMVELALCTIQAQISCVRHTNLKHSS